MSLYQQVPQIDDKHLRCRESVLRFIVLDYTIQCSIKELAKSAEEERINLNLENPYSIDIDQDEIAISADTFRFSCIHWNNLFSNNPSLRDLESEKLHRFLTHYFHLERRFLENASPKPDRITHDPDSMHKVTIASPEDPISAVIEGVIERNPKISIKKGHTKEEYDIVVDKITDNNNVANYYVCYNESEKRRSGIVKAYIDYRIDLFLQSILSFFIRYPDKIDDLVPQSNNSNDLIQSEFDLTNKIENMTNRHPSYDIVKMILKIFASMASLIPVSNEQLIIDDLLPAKKISELYAGNVEKKPLPQSDAIVAAAGLTLIRKELFDLLANDLVGGIDIFEDIVDICSSLLNDNLSEDMRFLDSELPTVISRFQSSQATPLQQDHFFRASDIVTDLLEKAITIERLSGLHDLSFNLKSTNITIHFFRSLYDLAKSFDVARANSNIPSKTSLNQLWATSSWYMLFQSNRLDFLFVILWILSPDTRLYKLYEYCRDRSASKLDKESGLISAAVFPGSLVEPLNGTVSLSTIYESQKIKNKEISQMLMTPGALESLMSEHRGRPI
jgi:hypothetical protein